MGTWLKWSPVFVLGAVWTAVWTIAWQRYLFDSLGTPPGPGLTVLLDERGSSIRVYTGSIVGIALITGGFIALVLSSVIREVSRGWRLFLLGAGVLLTLVGLILPVTFPSRVALVIDENARTAAVERHWLYTTSTDVIAFDDIERVGLRVQRKAVGSGCQIATGLSFIRSNLTWLDVPNGIDHERAGPLVAGLAGVEVQLAEVREC